MTDVETYLTRKGLNYKVRGGEAIAPCPECGGGKKAEKCWSINLETGAFICNRQNHCGWKGSLRDLQVHFGDQPIGHPKLMQPAPRQLIYKKPDTTKLQGVGADHYAWFAGRKINRETVDAYGIKGKPGAIAFPVHDEAGAVVNVKWRAFPDKKFWNETGTLRLPFGLQLVPKDSKALLIVEGELDALAAYQYGVKSVVSLPNGTGDQDWIDPLWDWLERFEEIWIATDMDEAGQGVKRLLVERLGSWRCRGVELPHKDLNDCLVAGIPSSQVLELMNAATEFKPEKLRGAGEFTEAVLLAFENREGIQGIPTGFGDLDRILKGWRGGELSIWTGQNGSGKSTVLGQVTINLVDRGEKVCAASLEMAPARYLRWLVCQLSDEEHPPEVMIRASMETLSMGAWFVDHVGSIDVGVLVDTFTYAARRYGVRHFIVDSLVKLKIRGDELQAQREAVEALCDFADRFAAHVHLVAHPRKGDTDASKPDKTAVKGSGDITDLADNVFSVFRNKKATQGQATTLLSVLKHREHGTEGDVPLNVSPTSKRVTGAGLQIGAANGRKRTVWSDAEIGD